MNSEQKLKSVYELIKAAEARIELSYDDDALNGLMFLKVAMKIIEEK